MQEGDVGASNSDLQTDKADDDDTHDARKVCWENVTLLLLEQKTFKKLCQR